MSSPPDIFRERIAFVAPGRAILYACLMAAVFAGLWLTVEESGC